jgi:hypothetical protein
MTPAILAVRTAGGQRFVDARIEKPARPPNPSDVEAIQAIFEPRQALVDCASTRINHPRESFYVEPSWSWRDAIDVTSVAGSAPDEAFQAWHSRPSYNSDGSAQYRLRASSPCHTSATIFLTMRDGETDWTAPGAIRSASMSEARTTRTFLGTLCGGRTAGRLIREAMSHKVSRPPTTRPTDDAVKPRRGPP